MRERVESDDVRVEAARERVEINMNGNKKDSHASLTVV